MQNMRRYLPIWLVSLLGILSCVGGLNFVIDPYGLIGTPRYTGFNLNKPAANTKVRMVKPYQVRRVQAHGLIIGNSRPEMGLDPTNPNWPNQARPVYSLTIPGSSVWMQVRYAQHAINQNKPAIVLMGVDFLDFLVAPDTNTDPHILPMDQADYEKRLVVKADGMPNPDYRWQRMEDYFVSLLSMNALVDSFKTLIKQNNAYTSTRTELGFNPAMDYNEIKILLDKYFEGKSSLEEERFLRKFFNMMGGRPWHCPSSMASRTETLILVISKTSCSFIPIASLSLFRSLPEILS